MNSSGKKSLPEEYRASVAQVIRFSIEDGLKKYYPTGLELRTFLTGYDCGYAFARAGGNFEALGPRFGRTFAEWLLREKQLSISCHWNGAIECAAELQGCEWHDAFPALAEEFLSQWTKPDEESEEPESQEPRHGGDFDEPHGDVHGIDA